MFPLTNSLRVSYLVCTCAPWGSGRRWGEGSSRGGSLRFRKCRGFERVVRADESSQQGVLQRVLSPSPGASLCSGILLIVKHADRRRECGCFTGPHELSTGSGSSGPSWNHVPWRNSQVNPGASFAGRAAAARMHADASCFTRPTAGTSADSGMINPAPQRCRQDRTRSSHAWVGLEVLSLKNDVALAKLVTLSLGFFVCKTRVVRKEQKITLSGAPKDSANKTGRFPIPHLCR